MTFRIHAISLLAALLGVAAVRADTDQAWVERVAELRKQVGESKKPVEESQKALYQLSLDFPVRTDWLLQDHPAEAWKFLMPQQSAAAEVAILAKHEAGNLEDWLKACEERREKRLRATLERWAPFVFAEGATHRMSFIGYTEGLSDARHERFFQGGSRLTVLDFAKGSTHGTTRTLIEDPHGMIRDVDVSFDRRKLLFAWKKSDRLDDYHIYEYALEDASLKQLTKGIGRADYEPIYLPDGDIIFASTRPEQSVPCWWTEISNLYRMDGEGNYVRRLAIDQVHTLYPQLMHNGRIFYTRWDYNDRGQNYPHPVFEMDPDGKAQRVYYGGNSWFPTSLLHTRAIPGTHKAISIAAGHHTRQRGKLVIVDVKEGRDEGKGLHFIAPKREKAYERVDVAMQYGDQFRYPFAFSEEEFLVSYTPDYGFDPKSIAGIKGRYGFKDHEHYGLYWINADGERELLHRAQDLGVLRPMPLGDRIKPPVIKERIDYTKKTASYYVHDVYRGIGLKGVERGEAKKVRVVRLNYRAAGVGQTRNKGEGGGSINSAPVAIANGTWDIKEILGDADIHEDGSAFFEVPAMESIYLQVLDGKGRVLQTTRTWDTLRPGEQKSCMGCHDKTVPTFEGFTDIPTLAVKKGKPQKLQPFYGETRGFSFNKEVQPILDRHCVECHDGSKEGRMDLTSTPVKDATMNKRFWTKSYINLTGAKRDKNGNYSAIPEEGVVTWISKMSRPTELPHSLGSIKSPLIEMIDEGHHKVKLTDEEYHKLVAWIDLLVPFSGTYREGGDWSDKDHDYYSYYETKRVAQAKEEEAAVNAFLDSLKGKQTKQQPAAAFTRAVYRALDLNGWRNVEGAWVLNKDHEPALIDRLEWQGQQPIKVLAGEQELGVLSGKVLTLEKPVRSGDLRVISAEAPVGVRLLGLEVRDLPEHEGFKRHLEFVH